MKTSIFLAFLVFTQIALGREGFGPGEQEWGYVTVREGAHMFWWLYYTTADVPSPTDRPLVVWLQGGPGGSSTAIGNFQILGPLDQDLNARDYTWVNLVNVLFVDNPVGTGFSYVDDYRYLTTDNRQIAEDFAELIKGIYETVPEFQTVPLYIFGQSYGGKMAVEMALVLDEKIKSGEIVCNLQGVALGNSWASPLDSVLNWAPFLLHVGAVDQNGYEAVQAQALVTKETFEAGLYYLSSLEWYYTELVIWQVAHNIDFYNILEKIPSTTRNLRKGSSPWNPIAKPQSRAIDLNTLMNGQVKEALGLHSTWGAQSDGVWDYLQVDFMKPVTHIVETLLNSTDIKVSTYSGQLDLICCTPGTVQWVDRLQWPGTNEWLAAPRPAISVNGINEGYKKEVGNLKFYWLNRAGHSAPRDNPAGGRYVLLDFTGLISEVSP